VETWRPWELVLGALERLHDVLALTLAGHAGGTHIDTLARAVREGLLARNPTEGEDLHVPGLSSHHLATLSRRVGRPCGEYARKDKRGRFEECAFG
jgi:hypothetical protein